MYVDDGNFIGDTNNQILAIIAQLQDSGLKIEAQGHPDGYVAVNSLTSILVREGIKNYRSVEYLHRNITFFAFFETQHNPQPPPPW